MARRRTGSEFAVTLNVTGDKQIQDAFKRFEHNAESQARAFEEISLLLAANEKTTWGKGWAAEAESTVVRKGEPDSHSTELMTNTGALYRSLTQPEADHAIREVTKHGLRWGSDLFYGRFQAAGTKDIPKRRLLRIPRKAVMAILTKHVMKGL